jgi:hypothetical protein
MHLYSPRIYLSVYPTSVLSTYTQNWHDYDAFQLPNSTAQYNLIDMSHYHESCISRFLLICSFNGVRAACADMARGVYGSSKANRAPSPEL